MIHTKNSIIY